MRNRSQSQIAYSRHDGKYVVCTAESRSTCRCESHVSCMHLQEIAPATGSAASHRAGPVAVTSRCRKARFTVLTPATIRMEWSPSGEFEDRASLTFTQRDSGTLHMLTQCASEDTWVVMGAVRGAHTSERFAAKACVELGQRRLRLRLL